MAIGLMIVTSSAYSQNETGQAGTSIYKSPVARVSEKCVHENVTLKASLLSAGVVGESTMLSVVVENRGDKKIPYYYGRLPDAFYFTLIDLRSEKPVPVTRFGRDKLTTKPEHTSGSIRIRALAPSESLTFEFNLARYFDLSRSGRYKVLLDWPADVHSPAHDKPLHMQGLVMSRAMNVGGPI